MRYLSSYLDDLNLDVHVTDPVPVLARYAQWNGDFLFFTTKQKQTRENWKSRILWISDPKIYKIIR